MPTHAENIISYIADRWSTDPETVDACKKIVHYIVSQPRQMSEMLTFTILSEISGKSPSSETLQQAIAILCQRFRVMEWRFTYIPEDGEPTYLSRAESDTFIRDEYVVSNGTRIDDVGDRVYPYLKADYESLVAPE